jgi:hypothetical protein
VRRVLDDRRLPVGDHAAVIRRVVERRAGKNKGVDEGDLEAHRQAPASLRYAGKACTRGAVKVDRVVHAHEQQRQNLRETVVDEPKVTDQRLVKDRVDHCLVVRRPLLVP